MSLSKNQQLLAYLSEKHPGATITVLIKLAYFVDLVAVKKKGEPISNFKYVRYFYGPFDKTIYADVEVLIEQKLLKPELNYTSSGDEYMVYRPLDIDSDSLINLSSDEKELIDGVLESVKGYGAKTLTEMAYKTKPMTALSATLGGDEALDQVLNLSA